MSISTSKVYRAEFLKSYLEAAYMTSIEAEGKPNLIWSDDAKEIANDDCEKFLEDAREILDALWHEEKMYAPQAGNDFWLTRNGHGAGFWDRGLGDAGDQLSSLAEGFRSCDDYIGDDGKLHLEKSQPRKPRPR